MELTIPYETNSKIARKRKQDKYRDLRAQLLVPYKKLKVLTLEITTLGFVTKNIRQFRGLCRSLNLQEFISSQNVWRLHFVLLSTFFVKEIRSVRLVQNCSNSISC